MSLHDSINSNTDLESSLDFDILSPNTINAAKENLYSDSNSNIIESQKKPIISTETFSKQISKHSVEKSKENLDENLGNEKKEKSKRNLDENSEGKNSLKFDDDFEDNIENDFEFSDAENSNLINLISMEQIEKEVDEIIKKDYPTQNSQEKPQYRVTFRPEVHEMAFRSYQISQIRKQQEKELQEYERMFGGMDEEQNFEEEEEEASSESFNDDFIDKEESSEIQASKIDIQNETEEDHQEINDSDTNENNSSILSYQEQKENEIENDSQNEENSENSENSEIKDKQLDNEISSDDESKDNKQLDNIETIDSKELNNDESKDSKQLENIETIDSKQLNNDELIDSIEQINSEQLNDKKEVANDDQIIDAKTAFNQLHDDKEIINNQEKTNNKQLSNDEAAEEQLSHESEEKVNAEDEQINEPENIPFIPPLDLSPFNSSKLISASFSMNKANKAASCQKPKRSFSFCGKIPGCVIPTTNKTHSKSHQQKVIPATSPIQSNNSPPKSSSPIKLEQMNQFENQNAPSNTAPMSLLEQVQKKSTENKAEELKSNGFMITFLSSPRIANKKQNLSSSLPKQTSPIENKDLTSLLLGTSANVGMNITLSTNQNDNLVPAEEEENEEIKQYSDDELKLAVDEMLNNRKLPPNEMHNAILVYIKNNIYKNIIDQDYDEAERLKTAQDMLSKGTSSQENSNERKMIEQSIESRIESTKDRIHELKQQWSSKIQRFEEEIHSKNDELELKQKEEISKFEETWNSNEILLQFNKPSAQLLEIRKMQKTKALSNDFSGARELKKRGDLLEKEETRRAERKAISSMKNAYNQLLLKQQHELEYAKQNWQRQRILIENERDQEIHNVELTLKQLIAKLNELKSKTNSKSGNLFSNSTSLNKNTAFNDKKKKSKVKRELTTPATTTPRTRKQIAMFRTEPRQEKLALNGLNVHKYVKNSSKANKKVSFSRLIREKKDF